MKRLLLERMPTTREYTTGFLSFPGCVLATIEQEWRPHPGSPGGEPGNSCVPDGLYKLVPHTRPNGDKVVALVNPDLGVYYQAGDRPGTEGRYMILIHSGNYVSHVIGCVAPGMGKAESEHGPMVTSSKAAVQKIMDYLGDDDDMSIDIRWICQG
jgi:hypothetical protein